MVTTSGTDAGPPALELRGVSAGYAGMTVLNNVSLRVEPGSAVALLGANGAGKTTLLRAASGLLAIDDGSITIAGKDSSHAPAHVRRRRGLCLVPEGRGVFPSLTVRENIYVQVPRRERARALERFLSVFPALSGRLGTTAGLLSGGQQQMLALARCYLQSPQVILVDEASMGLAPIVVDELFQALSELRKSGLSLLLVEQYIDHALALVDQVHVLNKGGLIDLGSPDQLDRDEIMQRYLGQTPEPASDDAGLGPSAVRVTTAEPSV